MYWLSLRGLAFAVPAAAGGLDLERLAAQPGTEIAKRTESGVEIVEIRRGGVTTTQRCNGDNCSIRTGPDHSGRGAVLCTWAIILETKAESEICAPDTEQDFRDMLTAAINRIDEFIIANSLTPTTQTVLEKKYIQVLAARRTQIAANQIKCGAGKIISDKFKSMSRDQFLTGIDDFLSVARPPVMEPCL